MPEVVDCPVCYPNSPVKDSKPWPIWMHRTLGQVFTARGRQEWRAEQPRIIERHVLNTSLPNSKVGPSGRSDLEMDDNSGSTSER